MTSIIISSIACLLFAYLAKWGKEYSPFARLIFAITSVLAMLAVLYKLIGG